MDDDCFEEEDEEVCYIQTDDVDKENVPSEQSTGWFGFHSVDQNKHVAQQSDLYHWGVESILISAIQNPWHPDY